MGKEIVTFGDIRIEKHKCHCYNFHSYFLKDVGINNLLVSSKISSSEKKKNVIGYLYDDYKVKPLHIILLKTSAPGKLYDGQTKWMYFLVKDDDLLEKYNTIWDKVSADIKKEFDSEPAYNKNFLEIKIKYYGDEATDFHHKIIPKVDSNHIC